MVAEAGGALGVARPLPGFWELAGAFWPGPLTIILPSAATLPPIVTAGGDTVALRIPDHPLALALLRRVGAPLAVTSANLSRQAPALTAREAWMQLDGRVDAIVDGGDAPGGQPSTIVDLTSPTPRILRRGPISESQIRAALLRD
jgi:L-threonylcarbamoyladenylate synthase